MAEEELHLVQNAGEVEQSLTTFTATARAHIDTTRGLFTSTDYWVHDPRSGGFGPAKFVGLAEMTFPRYEHFQELQRQGQKPHIFDGYRTQTAIGRALQTDFMPDAELSQRLRSWGELLIGSGAFGGATGGGWKFVTLRALRPSSFRVGDLYTRQEVYRVLNVPGELQGGNWDTGYNRYRDEWYIFAGVGTAGRTGHNYGNHWIGDDLFWRGKTNSRLNHESIRSMLSGAHRVHLFTREQDRSPFIYEGTVTAKETRDTTPVTIIWKLLDAGHYPDEVTGQNRFAEGATKSVQVNVYERNPAARRRCVEHYGARCHVCGLDFAERYGDIGEGFIHVHHIRRLSDIGQEYEVDAVADLRPVCPNCHAMLHRAEPPLSIDELRQRIRA
jgi:5-methylcytosine-specific restriction protein A